MELALLRSLMDHEFYESNKGAKCPKELFSTDAQKIKQCIDTAMDRYKRDITVDEVEALFLASNPTNTTAQRKIFANLFRKIKAEQPLGDDVAKDVLSKLHQQVLGEKIANIGFEYVSGTGTSLEDLRNLIEQYNDDFLPSINVDWDDTSIDTLLELNAMESRWKFNINTLARRVEGVNGGHLLMVGARSNVGKTSFIASTIAGPEGWAEQGAKCTILCNEEAYHRVAARILTASTDMTLDEIRKYPDVARKKYAPIHENIRIKDSTGRDMQWVESVVKANRPDIVVLDVADKFAISGDHEDLKRNAIHTRQIAKAYDCAVVYVSQLSAEAEGKINLNQSMLEGSRTGKAAETDLMLLLSRNPPMEAQEEEDKQRHISIAKNKLTGWHGLVHCELDHMTGRMYN